LAFGPREAQRSAPTSALKRDERDHCRDGEIDVAYDDQRRHRDAEALTRTIYGGEMGFLPWQRPGFDLGLKLGDMREANPHLKGVVLGGHRLFTRGPTSKTRDETTSAMIDKA
jgi:hypothetical protein